MRSEVSICTPSYKRASSLSGAEYFKTAKYVVPESQRDEYTKTVGAARLIVIPDECDGTIARKRNWILENVERPVLMIDDDVQCLCMVEGTHTYDGCRRKATERVKLTPDQAMGVITEGFNLAYQWGCVLWGINQNEDGRNYQQYRPFVLSQVVLGPFQGHLEHGLRYDERMGTKEDYDMSLQVLNKYKKVLRMNKYAYVCRHGDNRGGIVSMRTMERELRDCRAIEKKWGKNIISYPMEPKKLTDLLNGKVRVPIYGGV